MSTLNVSIPDNSPIIQYYPYADGSQQSGWNSSYTSGRRWARDVIAEGTSYHVTSFPGASATLTFEGTDIWVWGQGDSSNYEVLCDQTIQPALSGTYTGLLGSCNDLAYGSHQVELRVTGNQATGGSSTNQGILFDGMTLQTELGPSSSTVTNSTVQLVDPTSQWMNPDFSTPRGEWFTSSTFGGGDNTTEFTYYRATSVTLDSTLSYVVPNNTRFFYAYGSIAWNHRQYAVSLDDGQFVQYVMPSSWSSVDQLLYYTPLDPATPHNITFQNLGAGTMWQFDLHHVVLSSVDENGGESGSGPKSKIGVIVGVILASLVILGMIAGWLLWRRRKRGKAGSGRTLPLHKRLRAALRPSSVIDPDHRVVDLLQTESHMESSRSRRSAQVDWPGPTPFPAPTPVNARQAYTPAHGRSSSITYGVKPDLDPFADSNFHLRSVPHADPDQRSMWTADDDGMSTVAYTDIGAYGSEANDRDRDHDHDDDDDDTKARLSRISTRSQDVEMTTQAQDAGRLMAADDMQGVVPPQYDPSWRHDRFS